MDEQWLDMNHVVLVQRLLDLGKTTARCGYHLFGSYTCYAYISDMAVVLDEQRSSGLRATDPDLASAWRRNQILPRLFVTCQVTVSWISGLPPITAQPLSPMRDATVMDEPDEGTVRASKHQHSSRKWSIRAILPSLLCPINGLSSGALVH